MYFEKRGLLGKKELLEGHNGMYWISQFPDNQEKQQDTFMLERSAACSLKFCRDKSFYAENNCILHQ